MVEVAEKPAATDKSQESWEFSDSESWSNLEKEVTRKPVASRNSEIQKIQGILKLEAEKWPHHFHMSPEVVPHVEKVFDRTRNLQPKSNG